jgi:hypothetical protein
LRIGTNSGELKNISFHGLFGDAFVSVGEDETKNTTLRKYNLDVQKGERLLGMYYNYAFGDDKNRIKDVKMVLGVPNAD